MVQREQLRRKIIEKRCRNKFEDLRTLLEAFGFRLDRVARNSHYIFVHPLLQYPVNIARPHGTGDVKSVYCRSALTAIEEVLADDE